MLQSTREQHEICEVYLQEVRWSEIDGQGPVSNGTKRNMTIQTTSHSGIHVSNGGGWNIHGTLSGEATAKAASNLIVAMGEVTVKGGFEIGGGYEPLWSQEESKERSEPITSIIKPGETLYRYQKTHKLMMRT